MKKNYLLILAALFLVSSIMSCNTFRGAGKDVEAGGKGMQNIADHND